jgi:hypothetical protein
VNLLFFRYVVNGSLTPPERHTNHTANPRTKQGPAAVSSADPVRNPVPPRGYTGGATQCMARSRDFLGRNCRLVQADSASSAPYPSRNVGYRSENPVPNSFVLRQRLLLRAGRSAGDAATGGAGRPSAAASQR